MSNEPPDNKDTLLELLKKLWLPLAGFIGGITLIYNFYRLWLEDNTTLTLITAGVVWIVLFIALTWIILGKKAFNNIDTNKKEPRYPFVYRWFALVLLILFLVGSGAAGIFLYKDWMSKAAERTKMLVVMIAKFDGPEDQYGLRDELVEKLRQATKDDSNIEIVVSDTLINSFQGSASARNLGKNEGADIVIWAWYRPTENPNMTIHIENLSPQYFSVIQESETYQPTASITDLESFELQKQIGVETANFVKFLAGYFQYQRQECNAALRHFDQVLDSGEMLPVVNKANLFLFSGYCHSYLNEFNEAINDYDQAILADPNLAPAYNGRGSSYGDSGQYERAFQDCDQAILLDPDYAAAYSNRGYMYNELGQYERAIQDLNQAILIDPNLEQAYNNRGYSYIGLGQYIRAISDLDQAILINPGFAAAYNTRGFAYNSLEHYDRAIQDFTQAIRIDPNSSELYNNRAYAYNELGKFELAIPDLYQAIHIDPYYAISYSNRGFAYNGLGHYEPAIKDFDQAIQMDPSLATAYDGRGYAYNQLGQYDRAIEDFNRAIQLDSSLTEVYRNRGKTAEAEADFKNYEELTGEKP